jgi:1-acyl-sn-glycerol-3-phosphate acyltransferase
MKPLLKPFQWLYSIYALLLFIIIMLMALPLVIVASLFGRISGGNMIYKICKGWGVLWYFLLGIRHKNVYESPPDTSKQYIFTANHTSYMDIPPIVLAMNQPVRVLAKSELAKIPYSDLYTKALRYL